MSIRNISDVEDLLRASPSVRQLHAVWQERRPAVSSGNKDSRYGSSDSNGIPWLEDPWLARSFVNHALCAEEFLLVIDAAREILRRWETASEDDRTSFIHVRIDYAIALTRLGFTREARRELEPCVTPGFELDLGRKLKVEILIQLGHILRDEWNYAAARESKRIIAEEALRFYHRALEADPDRLEAMVFSASTAFILVDEAAVLREQAQKTASEILTLTAKLQETEGQRLRATAAEGTARAILGELEEAFKCFEKLQRMPGVTTPYLAEVRYNAQFLAEAQGQSRDFFKTAFPPLQLIVFAGHIPDVPGGRVRLPAASIPDARAALRAQLKDIGAKVGLVSASAGADLLFTEAIRDLGGTLHLVLPWSQDEFRRTSVLPFEPAGAPAMWDPLFEMALEAASTTREIGQAFEPSSDVGWEFMMEVTAGIALHAARALRLDIQPMVLWDGLPGHGAGGTDSFYHFWKQRLGVEPIVVSPPAVPSPAGPQSNEALNRGCERSVLHQEVKSMLFADIVGYSKLTEKVIPEFIKTFLERVGQLTAASKHAPCNVNTWGDAIYAVFDFAQDAGLFALELSQMVQEGRPDWLEKGLYWETVADDGAIVKHPLNIRIGLHTGPVVMHYDPVVRRLGFTGAHVNRAARIEPVAEPGQVFASEEFAAMVELGGALQQQSVGVSGSSCGFGFDCEYAGSMQLAKGYPGRHRIYRVVEKRVFALECLAKAAHESYFTESIARGDTPTTNTSLRAWDELSEDLREANRAQVADIPNKLRVIGVELASGHGILPTEIAISDPQLEGMAMREHERWMTERYRQGWTYAPRKDNARKLHPLLVPWERLSEPEKEKDRDTIRNLPTLVEKAGFRLRRI